MQVTCPHCGKTLKISEPSAAEEPLSDSRTALTPSGVVAIVAVTVGVVGVLAFGFGALLTRPNREAEAKKREVIQQEAAATQHELQTEISRLENANSRSATTINGLRADIDELRGVIDSLRERNEALLSANDRLRQEQEASSPSDPTSTSKAGHGFEYRNVTVRPDGSMCYLIGEIVNTNRTAYTVAIFEISLYDANDRLLDTCPVMINNFMPGQVRSFNEWIDIPASSLKKYRIVYSSSF